VAKSNRHINWVDDIRGGGSTLLLPSGVKFRAFKISRIPTSLHNNYKAKVIIPGKVAGSESLDLVKTHSTLPDIKKYVENIIKAGGINDNQTY